MSLKTTNLASKYWQANKPNQFFGTRVMQKMANEPDYDTRIVLDARIKDSKVFIRLTPEGKADVPKVVMLQLLMGMMTSICDYHKRIVEQNR